MVQRWAGSHDLPRSDQTLGPQVPVLTTITSPSGYISMSTCGGRNLSVPHILTSLSDRCQVVEVPKLYGCPSCLQVSMGRATSHSKRCQAHFPLMYFGCHLLLKGIIILDPSNVGGDPPAVEFAGSVVEGLVLGHWPNDELFKPGWQGFGWLISRLGLSIYVIDKGGTPWAVSLREGRDSAVVQEFDC